MRPLEIINQRDVVDGRGHRYTVIVVPDDDATPYDADCYSPDDVDAWRKGLWRYVGVLLRDGGGQQVDSLWGVEYGEILTGGTGGIDLITIDTIADVHPVPQMLSDLVTPHLRRYHVASWAASGDPKRPAPHPELSLGAYPGIAVTDLVERYGAWGSVLPQLRPDGRTVPTVTVHVAADGSL